MPCCSRRRRGIIADDALVQCVVPRAVTLRPAVDGEGIDGRANGEKWLFAQAAEIVLQPLLEGTPRSIAELCALAADTLERERVREFLGELLTTGLVAVIAVPEETTLAAREEVTATV
jgi:hypothetical protein